VVAGIDRVATTDRSTVGAAGDHNLAGADGIAVPADGDRVEHHEPTDGFHVVAGIRRIVGVVVRHRAEVADPHRARERLHAQVRGPRPTEGRIFVLNPDLRFAHFVAGRAVEL